MKPALVLRADSWQIDAEEGKQPVRGQTLYYVDFESPLKGRRRGVELLRISGTEAAIGGELREVPGYYHLHLRQRANRTSGRVELTLAGLDYAGSLTPPNGQAE